MDVLDKIAAQALGGYGYSASFNFITDRRSFWHYIENSQLVYRVAFKLSAPNLFGADKKANDRLKELQRDHGITGVSIGLENDRGNLNCTTNRDEIESYRDYADDGGGSWILIISDGEKREQVKSTDKSRIVEEDIQPSPPPTSEGAAKSLKDKLKSILCRVLEDPD